MANQALSSHALTARRSALRWATGLYMQGLDYAAVTVQLPGGERVPFLFTVKELNAKGPADAFGGDFVVPSYRGSTFLDPKVGHSNQVSCQLRTWSWPVLACMQAG